MARKVKIFILLRKEETRTVFNQSSYLKPRFAELLNEMSQIFKMFYSMQVIET